MSLECSNNRSSLLYIEVWKIHWGLQAHQKESFEACWSPMIFCLIWVLSYEGSISNPFLVWGNISVGRAVILVLLQSTTKVVEKVVVQFVHFVLFQRSWKSKHLRSTKSISRPLIHFFTSLATLRQDKKRFQLWVLQLLMNFRFWRSCFWWDASDELASDDVITSEAPFFRRFKLPFCWFFCSLLFF